MDDEVVRFFDKMPEAISLFLGIEAAIRKNMEQVSIKFQKSQIAFSSKRSFAYVWLPPRKIKDRLVTYVILSFGLDREIVDPRMEESLQTARNRFMNHMIISQIEDIDEKLLAWLKEAYEFANR